LAIFGHVTGNFFLGKNKLPLEDDDKFAINILDSHQFLTEEFLQAMD